jgi:hypothetical protein
VHPKVVSFATGYEDSLVNSNVWSTAQGAYFATGFRPFNVPMNTGTTAMKASLMKYGNYTASQFPDYGMYEAYLRADLMIQGLEKAGANPTSASVIKALRSSAYNGDGVLAITLNYATSFGYNTNQQCTWYELAGKTGFTATSPNATRSTYVKGSTSLTAPSISSRSRRLGRERPSPTARHAPPFLAAAHRVLLPGSRLTRVQTLGTLRRRPGILQGADPGGDE